MESTQFVILVGRYADAAAAETGLNRWAILTQWALETGWGSPNSTFGWNNLAGIIYHGAYSGQNGFTVYPTLSDFVNDYVAVLRQSNMAVILEAAGRSVEDQLVAFGESPWAGSHYNNGNGPGSSLIALWSSSLAPLAARQSPPQPPVVSPPSPSSSGGLSVAERDFLYAQVVKLGAAAGVAIDTPPWVAPQARTYTVQPGDSLSLIAQHYLGDANRWREVYDLNRDAIGTNPDLIYAGTVLTLPNE